MNKIMMSKEEIIRNSVRFDGEWDWTNIKWTDELKRLQFSCDYVDFSGILYWHKSDNQWIVVLTEDVTNDSGERIYGMLEECDSFDNYQNAQEYAVELMEEYS